MTSIIVHKLQSCNMLK